MTNSPNWSVGPRDTPVAALRRAAAAHPDKTFLDFSGEKTSYGEFDKLSNRLARSLEGLGVGQTAIVTSLLDNNLDAVAVWFALNKIHAVNVPLNTALVGEFLRHQIEDSTASIMVCESRYLPRVLEVAGQLTHLKTVLCRGPMPAGGTGRVQVIPLDAHRGKDPSPLPSPPDSAALAALIYTSGTTGLSKGCMISGNQMCHVARLLTRASPIAHDDVVWTPLPLFHMNAIATTVVSTLLAGATASISPRFSVSGFWPAVEASGATVVSILGSLGAFLANAPDNEAMKRCRGQVHTVKGNPFSEELKAVWRTRFGAKNVGSNAYGLTEVFVTALPAGQPAAPGSSGKRVPEVEVRIFDDEDREAPVGQPGEIVVRPLQPDIMFQGYWRRPEETVKQTRNQWFRTGDIGRFDADGFFYFVDRKKDALRRRGENISSQEMELTLLQHEAIDDVAVHAVPSPVGEDDVKVTAKLKPGVALSEEDLCRWLMPRVPRYAVPRYIEFRESLPTNPQGRVLKYRLREEGKTSATWDMEESELQPPERV